MKNQFQLIEIPFVVLLGTQWFLMEIDGNCREINLIRGSHPPERERERERCTNALRSWFILQFISNVGL